MSYRAFSGWNDTNELQCLLAFKRLQDEGFPHGRQTEICRELERATGLSCSTLNAKVGNYKSLAGLGSPSNCSSNSVRLYDAYASLPIEQLQEFIHNGAKW